MKKLNLLLATTAILSTGAILANAASVNENTANLTVSVGLWSPQYIRNATDVNFGNFLVTDSSSPITITMNSSTGDVTPGTGASVASNGSLGYVETGELNENFDIILPNSVNLYNTTKSESEAICSQQQANCHVITYVPSKNCDLTSCNIGGTLTIPAATISHELKGDYSGAFTVTAIGQ